VTLADEDKLFKTEVRIKNINLIPFDRLEGGIRVEAKLRYSQKTAFAFAEQIDNDEILLEFDEPQRAPAKGQSAVLYDGDYVLGGGIIQ
jgi:tRNA-specific 2-thiouridylase